jgi:hypothetical protein
LDCAAFHSLLLGHAAAAGAVVRFDSRVLSAAAGSGEVEVLDAAAGRVTHSARTVVDCTGRAAAVALANGGRRDQVDTLTCVFVRCRPAVAGDLDATTLVEAAPDGWWYTVRLLSGDRVVAYLSDGDLLRESPLVTADAFARRLRETTEVAGILGPFGSEPDSAPRTVPAFTARLLAAAGDGWVAAGGRRRVRPPVLAGAAHRAAGRRPGRARCRGRPRRPGRGVR